MRAIMKIMQSVRRQCLLNYGISTGIYFYALRMQSGPLREIIAAAVPCLRGFINRLCRICDVRKEGIS